MNSQTETSKQWNMFQPRNEWTSRPWKVTARGQVKDANRKRLHALRLQLGHSGKGRPRESGKRPHWGCGWGGSRGRVQRVWGKGSCSVGFHETGRLPPYIYQSPQNGPLRVSPTVDSAPWATVTSQDRFVFHNKWTTLTQMLVTGDHRGWGGVHGDSVLSHQFLCKPKTAFFFKSIS